MATRPRHLLPLAILLLAGCANYGSIYSDLTVPATVEFSKTPVGSKRCVISSYRLREPITRVGVSAEWDRGYVESMARDAGITNLCYADRRTITVFRGVYRQSMLILYGD